MSEDLGVPSRRGDSNYVAANGLVSIFSTRKSRRHESCGVDYIRMLDT
jgi:hypothetical protein